VRNFFAGDEKLPTSNRCLECVYDGVAPDITVTAKAPGVIDRLLSPVPPEQSFVYSYLAWAHRVGDPVADFLNGACGRTVQCGMPIICVLNAGPAAEWTLLNKSLASEAQLAEAEQGVGKAIAGPGTTRVLRDTPSLSHNMVRGNGSR